MILAESMSTTLTSRDDRSLLCCHAAKESERSAARVFGTVTVGLNEKWDEEIRWGFFFLTNRKERIKQNQNPFQKYVLESSKKIITNFTFFLRKVK